MRCLWASGKHLADFCRCWTRRMFELIQQGSSYVCILNIGLCQARVGLPLLVWKHSITVVYSSCSCSFNRTGLGLHLCCSVYVNIEQYFSTGFSRQTLSPGFGCHVLSCSSLKPAGRTQIWKRRGEIQSSQSSLCLTKNLELQSQ